MDFAPSAAEETFRTRVRAWLHANRPAGWGAPAFPKPRGPGEKVAFARCWQRRLHEGGWAGVSWPREYGGQALSPHEQLMFHEECFAAGAPDMIDIAIGLNLVGPTLIHHGTEAQKKRFLEPILRGDEVWCQGFSEPGAGSDLAALRTRAEVKSDRLVINGQKVWTSYARFAEWCILIARTNPGVAKHRGLTFVVVDMRTPGIRIRPLVEMTGVAWFNEVFLEDVEVPLDMVIGRIDQGWDIAITTLSHERGTVVPYQRLRQHLDALVALAGRVADRLPTATRALVRQRLAQLCIDVELLRLSTYRSVSGIMRAGRPGPEGSMLKVLWSELEQRIMEAAGWLSGTHAALDEHAPQALDAGRWQYGALWSRAATIYAGTSEVQRNIIAQRVLGLPRA